MIIIRTVREGKGGVSIKASVIAFIKYSCARNDSGQQQRHTPTSIAAIKLGSRDSDDVPRLPQFQLLYFKAFGISTLTDPALH